MKMKMSQVPLVSPGTSRLESESKTTSPVAETPLGHALVSGWIPLVERDALSVRRCPMFRSHASGLSPSVSPSTRLFDAERNETQCPFGEMNGSRA